jgi:hypothetical protein
MTQRPGLGKTRHRWLIGDAADALKSAQTLLTRIIVEIRREQERPGRPQFQDIAILVAELAQTISRAAAVVDEMGDLVESAQSSVSDSERLLDLIADLQEQVRRLNEKVG